MKTFDYEKLCGVILDETEAQGVIILYVDQSGDIHFSGQANSEVILGLPNILEYMAKKLRESVNPKLN